MKQWIIIGLIVVVLIGSYLWNRNRNQQPEGEDIPNVDEVMVTEDGQVVQKNGDGEKILSEEEANAIKDKIREKVSDAAKVVLQSQAVEKAVELLGSAVNSASGESQAVVEDGVYYQRITVTGLPAPQKGYYYEAWLQKDGESIAVGRVEITGSSGEVLYTSAADRSEFKTFIITYEIEDGNPEMGAVVLKGEVEQVPADEVMENIETEEASE